jgi:hypothetical protein
MHSQWVTLVQVSPKSATKKGYVIDNFHIFLKEINVRPITTLFTQIIDSSIPLTMIELMVTCYIDHMREVLATAIKEVTETISLLRAHLSAFPKILLALQPITARMVM